MSKGSGGVALVALAFLASLMAGCGPKPGAAGKSSEQAPSYVLPPDFPRSRLNRIPSRVGWCARNDSPEAAKALVSNGEYGIQVGWDGTGFDADKHELPAFRRFHFDLATEDIKPVVNPFAAELRVNGERVSTPQNFHQSLDFGTGTLSTGWVSLVKDRPVVIECLEQAKVGEMPTAVWEFRAPAEYSCSVVPAHPETMSLRSQSETTAKDGYKTVQVAFSVLPVTVPSGPWPEFNASLQLALGGPTLPSTDIEIDGPAEDQVAVRSFIYYLRRTLPTTEPFQLSPMGLSSAQYNGHVFWDADVWMEPALAFIEPQVLQGLVNYRLLRTQAAPHPPYVWESSITGKETAPGSSKNEIHISGSVAWGFQFAAALGAKVPQNANQRVASYYLSRIQKRTVGKFDLKNVMSPDENHIGDNDLYTNLVAQFAINGGRWHGAAPGLPQLTLPSDSQSFLTYDGDTVKGYKQAAAVLAAYPLQYPPAEAQARTLLSRFEDKVSKNGPAMSDSVHATLWARLGEPERAYTVWRQSWQPFLTGPFLQFSEKRGRSLTYFYTGAAGSLQTVIYGFLGLRVDETKQPNAAWSCPISNGRWLSISPHLPSAWRQVRFKNFHLLGKTYTLTVTRKGTKTITTVT